MGIFGTNPRYTVRDNKTGEEVIVRDPRDLEKYAAQEQHKDPDRPPPFLMRVFGTTNNG